MNQIKTGFPEYKLIRVAYLLSLTASVWLWFLAIRSPLWLDETISFCQIHLGFSHVTSQPRLTFPAYSYILWFFTKILGTSEAALRVPSILAMLAAVHLLYRAARDLFDRNIAMITVILFCANRIVIFAAIDARAYAFAALAISASICLLVRLRESDSIWLAGWFGVLAAVIIWFHFLFAVMTPALLIGFFIVKLAGRPKDTHPEARSDRDRVMWRQFGAAVAGYIVAFLPLIPGLLYLFRTSTDHPFDSAPELGDLILTIVPVLSLPALAATAFVGLIIAGLRTQKQKEQAGAGIEFWRILLCPVLALIPLLILFTVSVATPLHIFVERYRLVAVAGISLCWALLVSGFKPRVLQAVFCLLLVGVTAVLNWRSPEARQHGYTWKYALEAAQKNTSSDNAPVLVCSDLPEADHMPLPVGDAVKDSNLFAPLSYYKLSAPVVALPRALNDDAIGIASRFVEQAAQRHQRFLAFGYVPSHPTLEWLTKAASASYDVKQIGDFDGIILLEFKPRVR